MANLHIAALHDRIDEEHFEMRLHASAIAALQRRVNQLEAAVRELRGLAFNDEGGDLTQGSGLVKSFPRRVRTVARRGPRGNLQGR